MLALPANNVENLPLPNEDLEKRNSRSGVSVRLGSMDLRPAGISLYIVIE